jgi:hypothetical protein
MIIGCRNNLSKINADPTIKIGGESINRVKTTKSLGVVIDDKLKWEDHIDSISKKVSSGIGAILENTCMHAETLALLTKPLYFPNMKYLK